MEALKNKDRRTLVSAAMGRIACDMTITNARFVNVITGEIYPAEVDIKDGVVVRVRAEGEPCEIPSATVFDAEGRYLVPGCFDTHIHIESTLMIPSNFGKAAIRCGTTTIVHDPHEIGNVMGIPGVDFMLEDSKKSPVRTYALAPTCLPSVEGVESCGAVFGAAEIEQLLEKEGVIGLAEIMDYVGVVNNSDRMVSIIEAGLKRNAYLQGHLPGLAGNLLSAYQVAGPVSCHESNTARQVRQKLRNGMHVNLRSSSLGVDDVRGLLSGTDGMMFRDNVSLCTDDVHAKDILETGHVNRVIKRVLEAGVDPVTAYKFATYNAAREYGFSDLGAIAPGFAADLQLLDELDGRNPHTVMVAGRIVVSCYDNVDGRETNRVDFPNTVNMPQITGPESFRLKAPAGCGATVRVGVMSRSGGIGCDFVYEELPVRDGYVDISGEDDLCFAAIVNRYGRGNTCIAIRRGFGLEKGAVASTISHDCHNFTVVYKNAEDAFAVAEELARVGGGVSCACGGQVIRTLALPVAGLMCDGSAEEIAAESEKTDAAIAPLFGGCSGKLLCTAILALPCVPGVVMTDFGVYDGRNSRFLPIFSTE